MPRDLNGNYSLPTGYKAASGGKILVSQHNPPMGDMASALTESVPRTGVAPMLANLPMGGKATGMADGTADTDAMTIGQFNGVQAGNVTLDGAETLTNKTLTAPAITLIRRCQCSTGALLPVMPHRNTTVAIAV